MYKVYLLYFFSLFVTTAIHSTELITPHFERLRNVEGHVYSVYQDTDGFLWIGSKTGVARYDGAKFIHFDSRDNALPLTNDNIQTITEDSQGRLWLGSRDGLNVLNKDRTEIRHIYGENDGKSLSHSEIRKVIEDKINGGFWIATYGGGVNYFNESTGLYTYFKHDPNNMFSIPGDYINDIWLDTRGRLWVACEVGGVAWYNDVAKQFIRVSLQNNNGVEYTASAILEDKQGNIWVGTWIKGLYRYNENSKELESIIRSSRLDDPKNTIRRLINDSDTHIWVATLGGLMKLNLETLEVNLYQNENNKGGSIASNKIWSIYKDEESILWVGTLDKGLCKWDPKAHKFHLYEPYLSTVYDLKNDNVSALYYDKHSKILWIATMNNQIHLLDIEKKRYLDNQILKQLDGHGVTSICKDETGRFWLTSAYGISVYDSSTKQLKMYPKEIIKMESQEIGGVYSCSFGASGNLYFGAWGAGLVVLPSHKINKPNLTSDDFIHLSIANSKLESNVIWNVLSDGKGDIWVDCKRGVYLYNEHKKKITKFSDQSLRLCKTIDGKIYGINPIGQLYKLSKESGLVLMKDFKEDDLRLEQFFVDSNNQIWLSTSKGVLIISETNPSQVTKYDYRDGLSENSPFLEHTFLDGNQIVLGNSKGIMVINPRTLKDNDDNPIVKLSEVLLFGSEISHSQDEVLELSHDENELTFSFNPKSLSSTVNSTIWYKLNSEKHWHITTKENPKAHYPQLESGEYSLYVKTSLNGTNQMNKPLLTFRIRPPWWFSYWAIAGYLIIAFIVLKLIFNYSLISIKAKNKLEMQSFEKQQQEKLMQSKLDFFTNITHEIKTPLTLIIGPIEKLIKETSINKKATQSLNTVHKNAKHLQVLFDELLEFRRIESGVASLQLQEVEVVSFLRQIISHYNELAFLRSVSLNIQTDLSELNLLLDSLKIEKVVHNLLSNALKNTNEEGEILVILKCNNEQNFIEVAVENSGAGIPEELINVIFDQFVTGHENKGGSGVGLALSKRIIELHKGTIIARNTKKGALFTVTLPLLKPNKKEEEVIEVLENGANQQGQPSILIVEDNIEIRLFIISILERNYTIYTAGNGVEALEVVRSYEIDLILSDVMMPVMDGVELVKTIKNNLEYCHIPIMLLTAKAGIVHELEGLRAQADAYIYKPFNYEVLKQKIQNILHTKKLWKQRFLIDQKTSVDEHSIKSLDEELMEKVVQSIELNLTNPELNVEFLSREIGMHRSNFSKKIKALTGFSPVHFISTFRINKAKELLSTGKLTVADVAYEVGFNNPKYFSSMFKQHVGKSPTEFLNQL